MMFHSASVQRFPLYSSMLSSCSSKESKYFSHTLRLISTLSMPLVCLLTYFLSVLIAWMKRNCYMKSYKSVSPIAVVDITSELCRLKHLGKNESIESLVQYCKLCKLWHRPTLDVKTVQHW